MYLVMVRGMRIGSGWPGCFLIAGMLMGGCGKKEVTTKPGDSSDKPTNPVTKNPSNSNSPVGANATFVQPSEPKSLPPLVSDLPLEEQARREMVSSYFWRKVDPSKLPGEDLVGDGHQDIGRLAFDAQFRQSILKHVQEMQIGFSQHTVSRALKLRFSDTNGVHNTKLQQQFEESLADHNLTTADWRRSVHNDLAITHLHQLQGLAGGFFPTRVARQLYLFDQEKFETDVIIFAASNYVRQVTNTTKVVDAYYQKNAQRYRQPDRLNLVYLALRFSVFDPAVVKPGKVFADKVAAIYKKQGGAIRGVRGNLLSSGEAKAQIRRQLLVQRYPKTQQRFKALIQELSGGKVNVSRLRKIAAANPELSVLQLEVVPGLQVPANVRQVVDTAITLAPDQLSARPAVEDDGLYMVGLVSRTPQPFLKFNQLSLDQQDIIRHNHLEEESLRLALSAGQAFAPYLLASVNAGKAFEAVTRGRVWKRPLPPFNLSQVAWSTNAPSPQVPLGTVQRTVFPMLDGGETARISGFVQIPGGGFILRLKKRQTATSKAKTDELQQYVAGMRRQGLAAASYHSLYPVPVNPRLTSMPPGWIVAEWEHLKLDLMLKARALRIASIPGQITATQQKHSQAETQLRNLSVQKKDTSKVKAQINLALRQIYQLKQEHSYYQTVQARLAKFTRTTGAIPRSMDDKDRKANDALLDTLQSTNVVTSDVLLKVRQQHLGTTAAHRALFLSACNLFHQERPDYGKVNLQLDQMLLANPKDHLAPLAMLGRAVCLDELGKVPLARTEYGKLISQHPNHIAAVPARLALALISTEAGDNAGAHAQYQAVINTDPVGYWGQFAGPLKRRLPPVKPPK